MRVSVEFCFFTIRKDPDVDHRQIFLGEKYMQTQSTSDKQTQA